MHRCTNAYMVFSFRFYTFPHYIETTTFGISCDAYTNLKETLTRHKTMVADYLDKNYDRVRTVSSLIVCFRFVFEITYRNLFLSLPS